MQTEAPKPGSQPAAGLGLPEVMRGAASYPDTEMRDCRLQVYIGICVYIYIYYTCTYTSSLAIYIHIYTTFISIVYTHIKKQTNK